MSLDIYLVGEEEVRVQPTIYVRKNGRIVSVSQEEWDAANPGRKPVVIAEETTTVVYHCNITHNLVVMAGYAGLYKAMWSPEDIDAENAGQLVSALENGVKELKSKPNYYKKMNPKNGWGSYEVLLEVTQEYLEACKKYPETKIEVSG